MWAPAQSENQSTSRWAGGHIGPAETINHKPWKICAVSRPPLATLETPQFHHQAPLIHLVMPIHTSIWRQMTCLSLSVKVFLYFIPRDPPSREPRILGNQRWLYHVGGGGVGGWGIGCPGGEVTLTSQLPVSVRFGSGGMEWVGGTISGLHQEKPGKAACCFHQETC